MCRTGHQDQHIWLRRPLTRFRLLKLHGSLNWYWNPGDESGASVARRDLPGVYGTPLHYTDDDRRRQLPGRGPLIVPPSATKSLYYRNPITREMWQQAALAQPSGGSRLHRLLPPNH